MYMSVAFAPYNDINRKVKLLQAVRRVWETSHRDYVTATAIAVIRADGKLFFDWVLGKVLN